MKTRKIQRARFMSNSSCRGRRKEPPGAGKTVKEEPFGSALLSPPDLNVSPGCQEGVWKATIPH